MKCFWERVDAYISTGTQRTKFFCCRPFQGCFYHWCFASIIGNLGSMITRAHFQEETNTYNLADVAMLLAWLQLLLQVCCHSPRNLHFSIWYVGLVGLPSPLTPHSWPRSFPFWGLFWKRCNAFMVFLIIARITCLTNLCTLLQVPSTLGSILCAAWARGELAELWSGPRPIVTEKTSFMEPWKPESSCSGIKTLMVSCT